MYDGFKREAYEEVAVVFDIFVQPKPRIEAGLTRVMLARFVRADFGWLGEEEERGVRECDCFRGSGTRGKVFEAGSPWIG